jgi:protoporphyrinogen oxidase
MDRCADLVVLGAGPAGLAAAWLAAQRGHSVTVLERAPHVGGLSGSIEVAGVRVDKGAHRLHPATPAPLLDDLRRLLGDDLQLRRRNGRLRVAGRWVRFPLHAGDLARRLPPALAAGIARDASVAPLRRGPVDSYAGALRKSLGPTLYEAVYAPYAEKLWGRPGERISADQARRRVVADTPLKMTTRVLRRRGASGQSRAFYYPRRGFGQLTEALAEAAVGAGATILTGAAVDRLHINSESVRAHTGDGREVLARHAFSTVPLPALARLTTPGAPLVAIEAASRLRFRAMVLVYLVHDGAQWTPYDSHHLPDGATPVSRISEPTNFRDNPEDPTDRTVICAEIPCAVGDEIWTAHDEALADEVVAAIAATGLPGVRRIGVHVERIRHVYPIYALGYERHLGRLETWVRTLPRVTTFGRLGLFAHDNTHHALTMAYEAVAALGDGGRGPGWDEATWSAARERFAEHVVED